MGSALEELIAWATDGQQQHDDLVAARAEHRARTGEVFDDDRQIESRLLSFLEWYVCERRAAWLEGQTPARAWYLQALRSLGPAQAARAFSTTCTVRALFEVTGIEGLQLSVRELVLGVGYQVRTSSPVAATAGDVFEARLLPVDTMWELGGAPCWHSRVAAPLLMAEARRRRRLGVVASPSRLADEAAQRSLKADRYRQVALERIYDFSGVHGGAI